MPCTRWATASRFVPDGDLPPLRLFLYGPRQGVHHHARARSSSRRIASSRAAATKAPATSGVPATSASMLAAGRAGHAGRLDRSVGDDRRARPARSAARPSAAGARRLIEAATRVPTTGLAAELVLAADQFIITPAGRVEDAARARAAGDEVRTVIAGYHWFTDWGRDTMISLEGLTLCDRPARRGGLHPAHVRPLRARRPDPEPVSRRREGRALSHGRRHAVVLPRARPLRAGDRRPRDARGSCCRRCIDIVEHHVRGTRFGIGVDPADGLLRQGAGGLSAHLDGRQGRRLGRHAAARQGGRDQRALVQRAAPARAAGCARQATTPAADATATARPSARASRSIARFWYERRRLSLRRRRRRAGRRCGAAGPNQIFAISLDHPVLDRGALASRCSRSCASGC